MDERFGEWLRDALADVDDAVLKRRWDGVESLASELQVDEIMDLLVYSAICRIDNSETLQRARSAFWQHDNAFRMQGNDLELRRLCGAVVIHVLRGESAHAMAVALACVCLHFGGVHDDRGLVVMSREAEKILQGLSANARAGDCMKDIGQRAIVPSRVTAKFKELTEEGYDTVPIGSHQEMMTQFGKSMNQLAKDQFVLRNVIAGLKEETNILWWLTGNFSNDLKQPFREVGGATAAVVAGKELADHVFHRPGPLSGVNVLRRMIQQSKDHSVPRSLKSLVTELPLDWKRKLADEAHGRALRFCPLLAAIAHSANVEDDPSWITPFSKQFPYSTESEISPMVLGYQMYRERMMALDLSERR